MTEIAAGTRCGIDVQKSDGWCILCRGVIFRKTTLYVSFSMTVASVASLCLRSAAFLLFAAMVAPAPDAGAETLTVKVAGLHGTAGNLHVMVWNAAPGFPMEPEKAVARQVIPVAGPHQEVTFSGLAKGLYAVAAYQDLNSNGKLDRSVLGWPTEPVGASNGATGFMGPPKFKDAAFQLKQAAQSIDLSVK